MESQQTVKFRLTLNGLRVKIVFAPKSDAFYHQLLLTNVSYGRQAACPPYPKLGPAKHVWLNPMQDNVDCGGLNSERRSLSENPSDS